MSKTISPALEELIRQACESHECHPVEIVLRGSGDKPVLEVFIDGVEPVTVEKCRDVAEVLNNASEANQVISPQTIITVSSPGVDKPLLFLWQYHKHIGRTLSLSLADDTSVEGVLIEVTNEEIVLQEKPQRKGAKTQPPSVHIVPFSTVRKALVNIAF